MKRGTLRVTVGKSLRFDIFNRDGFTCQYCGHKPPDVMLELDHIVPVAKGGDNDEMNLITSCADCNRGKSAKILTDVRPIPDADLQYLKTEQQRLEYERYLDAKARRDEAHQKVVSAIQETWAGTFRGELVPSDGQITSWLSRYSPELIERGIVACFPVFQRNQIGEWGFENMLRYVGAVIRNKAIEEGE